MLRGKLALVGGCVLAVGSGAHAASLLDTTAPSLPGWAGPTGFVSWDAPTGLVSVANFGTGNGLLLSSGSTDTVGPATPIGSVPLGTGVAGYVGASDFGGHPVFDAGGPTGGSAVKRTFIANPGDIVTLTYDFFTTEGSAAFSGYSDEELANLPGQVDDFAFVTITHAGHTEVFRIADVVTPGMIDILEPDDDGELVRVWSHTGLRTLTLSLFPGADITDGNYTIALGVMNGAGATSPVDQTFRGYIYESQLHVFSLDVSGPSAVPLPASASAGVVLLGSYLAASLAGRVRLSRRAAST